MAGRSTKYPLKIVRACGLEKETDRMKFCIIDYIDSPVIVSEDIFYISKKDLDTYFANARCPPGSVIVLIGNLEIVDKELKINEIKLIYGHQATFSSYQSSVDCVYNIRSFYERQKAVKRYEDELKNTEKLEEERKQNAIKEARRRLDAVKLKNEHVLKAEQTINDDSVSIDEKIQAIAFLRQS